MTLVKDLYDKLAVKTGFPLYTNEFDTPDITRFLLDVLSEALQSTIDSLYISNNILERNDTLITIPNKNLYGIEGVIKSIQIQDERGTCYSSLKYADDVDQNDNNERFGKPVAYVIKNGYLKLLPTPDKEYTIKLCVSTTDLVLSDDDTSRTSIEHIEDSIAGSDKFCDLVVLSACALTFTRCNNPLAQVYRDLYENRLRTFMEHDLGTMEAQRFTNPDAGHYDSMRGLIRDDFRRGWF